VRYLFVPAPTGFADDYLAQPRKNGECLCLGADVPFRSDDSWPTIRSRFPANWQPDVIVVWLADPHVPDAIWSAPVPIIGLTPGWYAHGHYYRHLIPLCVAILAAPPCVVALSLQGYETVAVADFSGLGESALLTQYVETDERDIDVLVLDPLTLPEPPNRNRYAGRVAELSDICRIHIHRPTNWDESRSLLARAKLALLLPTPTGEDRLTYEAIAAGALPVRPKHPWDGVDWLRPGLDFAPYQELDLEQTILALLQNDSERQAMVRAGRSRLRELHFANRLGRALAGLQTNLGELNQRAVERAKLTPVPGLGGRMWASLAGGPAVALPTPGSVNEPPEVTVFRGVLATTPLEAIGHFERVLQAEPDHPVAWANLAEALAETGRSDDAIKTAQQALARLDRSAVRPILGWDVPLYPAQGEAHDLWEAAAWSPNATLEANVKRRILRWKLNLLLAGLTKELSYYHEAALTRPDWPAGRAALGCAFARLNRPFEAITHLSAAVDADPFDRPAARALYASLREADDHLGARLFARRNRRLAQADPSGCPVEPWFADAVPVGDELVTIVVVDTQSDPPHECLSALMQFSRPPFEILVIGSEDTAWLKNYPGRNISALRVATNLSPLEMANRGIAQAQGEFIAVVESRTVVGPHWLDRLLAPLCDGWPKVAAVGPKMATTFTAQANPTTSTQWSPRLAWSCLLSHRAMWDKVGPFDAALGGFAADDWSARAREAGFFLAVAKDVRVQATEPPGTPEDFEAFRSRWGSREAAAYHAVADGWNRRPTVSACLIVRNEEAYLAECLDSIAGLVDELIIVDTGSTDSTREIAARFGARVFEFPWVDSFAAARNQTLRHATGDWIFWLDADDRLDAANREEFQKLTTQLTFAAGAYVFKCRCLHEEGSSSSTVVDHVRLFRNDPRLKWTYRVHEQILQSIRTIGMPVSWSPVTVTHVGYAVEGARVRKLQRDMRLLQLEDQDHPNDPFTQFNLGCLLLESGQPAEALERLNQSLKTSHPGDSIVRKVYAQIALCHRHLGHEAAYLGTITQGLGHYPHDAELLTMMAKHHEELSDWELAVGCWRQLVEEQDDTHFASVSSNLRGASARAGLANALRKLGRHEAADAV
jgi:tetratricopeptide (TPR) repeat protein